MPKLPGPTGLPPFWLALSIAAVWGLDRLIPFSFFGFGGQVVGAGMVVLGLGLMLGAALQMWRHRTTFIPGRDPAHLVTTGFFRFSRNPIYLGDAFVLSGIVLWLDVPLGFLLVIGFMTLIQYRFILAEEARLNRLFPGDYRRWAAKTGRWIG